MESTVTEEHSYIYAGGRLLRETITTTAANGTVATKVLDFAYDAQGTPYSLAYTNGTATEFVSGGVSTGISKGISWFTDRVYKNYAAAF